MLNRGDTSAKLVFPLPEELVCLHSISNGQYIVGGAKSGRILIWAPSSGRLLRSWDAHYGAVTCLDSHDDGVLISGGEDAAVHVWMLSQILEFNSDILVTPMATMAEHTMPVTSIHVSNGSLLSGKGRVYSASRDHTCKQWRVRVESIDNGKETKISGRVELLATLLYPSAVRSIVVDLQETRVFVATTSGVFQTNLYQVVDGKGNGSSVVSIGGSSTAVISEGHIKYPALEQDMVAVSLSIDATLLVTAISSGVVRVWDTASRQCLRTLTDKSLLTGVQQLFISLAPPQLGGPRATATSGLHRPPVLTDTVIAPKISSISFMPLQRIAPAIQQQTTANSFSAFDAPVRTKLKDTAEDIKMFEDSLVGKMVYSETARGDMELVNALVRPQDESSERLVADLLRQTDRLQRHHARTRRLNDELYQGAVTEWLANRQKSQSSTLEWYGRHTDKHLASYMQIDTKMVHKALLLTEDYQLIEFPSVLLPKGVILGSVVNIDVCRDRETEKRQRNEFRELQEQILKDFGTNQPKPPVIRVGHTTQTWVVIQWEPLDVASAELKSLHLYRDGQRMMQQMPVTLDLANSIAAVKTTGLDVDHEYDFMVEMRTSAGTFFSNTVTAKTHSLDNLSGICVCFGDCESQDEINNLKETLDRIGATYADSLSFNVTHLVARYRSGSAFEDALKYNIPIVKPDWVLACEANGKLQPAIKYALE
ncbi:hypothetical protein GGF39_004048 [Coemansia sp. RSA 1721]|nr:hypothetical protein GGF39_004048 [Coemansia sp. RSA 1721]